MTDNEQVTIKVPYDEPDKPKLDLSNLQRSLAQNPTPPQKYLPLGTIDLGATTGADSKKLFNLFANIDSMNDQQLYNTVATTYDAVLSYGRPGAPKEEEGVVWRLFNNVRYVMALSNVLSNTQLVGDQLTCCNKIIYAYMTSTLDKNPMVKQAIDTLASVVNKDTIRNLSDLVLPEGSTTAAYIGVCALSSPSPIIGVKRLNLYMINSEDDHHFNERTIGRIYEELYCSSLTNLVEGVMFDAYSKEDLNNMSEASRNIYYIQNLALLNILNQAPNQILMQVLRAYSIDFFNFGKGKKRFSFIVDPVDYSRIDFAIKSLAAQNVYVP
jgi:hypothetical protein